MIDGLTLSAALLLGLAASGHCLVMCGGISAALGVATAKNAAGKPQAALLLGYQFGRIATYALAGALFGGMLGGLLGTLDIPAVSRGLRGLSVLALLFGAFVAFGRIRDPGAGVGRRLWVRLAPLGRRLLPVDTLPRAVAFGLLWGWMPCGFVYTVLLVATLQLDAVRAAATMTAFGLGMAPALLASAFGAQRFFGVTAHPRARHLAGVALLASAALTLAGPWLPLHPPWLHASAPLDCTAHP